MTTPTSTTELTFAQLGVRDEIVRALDEKGIQHPFAIQELTLPLALAGDDLIGQARTGMGKTFAFGVPLLQRITAGTAPRALNGTPRALVVVPTRELCLQVTDDLTLAAKHLTADGGRPLSVVPIYGGRPYEPQIDALRAGADVVVGTPGRLLDLAQQGHLQLGGLSVLVLDEADEMLDLGFLPDIERILRQIPDDRQSMLFSATMPDPIITLARTFMNQPTHIRAEAPHSAATHDTTVQYVYRAHALDKVELVSRVLQAESRGATMIFTRTKRTAQKVADELAERGFKVGAVHGDLGQVAREKALKAFRTGDIDVLVATDVAARGIDIDDVTHVINYQIPEDEQAYVHRIGRTASGGGADGHGGSAHRRLQRERKQAAAGFGQRRLHRRARGAADRVQRVAAVVEGGGAGTRRADRIRGGDQLLRPAQLLDLQRRRPAGGRLGQRLEHGDLRPLSPRAAPPFSPGPVPACAARGSAAAGRRTR